MKNHTLAATLMFAGALSKLEVIIEEEDIILQEPGAELAIMLSGGEETTEHYLAFAEGLVKDGCNLHISPSFEWKMRTFGEILRDLLTGQLNSVTPSNAPRFINWNNKG